MHFTLELARKPLRYYGLRGILLLLAGFGCISRTMIMRIVGVDLLGNSPLVMIGVIHIITGSSLWGIGLLGEILTFA